MYVFNHNTYVDFRAVVRQSINKFLFYINQQNSLFGEGTYLSSDISVSMPYSPVGTGWNDSSLGTALSCVVVCELIDHPDVKCQTRGKLINMVSSSLN